MTDTSRLRPTLPFSRSVITTLVVLGAAFAGMCALAIVEFPQWSDSRLSPVELAIWLLLFVSAVVSINAMRDASPEARRTLQVAFAMLSAIIALQSVDFVLDWDGASALKRWFVADSILTATVATIIIAALLWLLSSKRPKRGVVLALLAIVAFQLIALLAEFEESGKAGSVLASHLESTEFLELLCIEAYLIGLVLARGRSASALPTHVNEREFGTYARTAFYRLSLVRDARHPPALVAFVPGATSLLVTLSAVVLTFYAGTALKKTTGLSRWQQFRDMLALWRDYRIDPPSYYALDLFKARNQLRAGEYMTRYETKNGLLHVLNFEGPGRPPKGELTSKQRFRDICETAKLATPMTLAKATRTSFELLRPESELRRDLFCKPENGMGAMDTVAYSFAGPPPTHYTAAGESLRSMDELKADVQRHCRKKTLLVQPWLKNHAEIASLADQSLLVFRVITCISQQGQPEVALAMLRLLAKLEPEWHNEMPDGEYASPIDIATGELGLFTGDSPRTAALRYESHPMTGERICGKRLSCWPEIAAFALKLHATFAYRTVIGWDIALTPEGPVALEGNSNFDVMFLQRVLDEPIGLTPLGPLLRPHIEALYATSG